MGPRRQVDPHTFLPLTHLTFYLLLVLVDSPSHGYGLVQRIRERSDGLVDPGTGSFYSIIHGAVGSGLIQEDPTGSDRSSRRRQFAITKLGRDVLAAELRRLQGLLNETRQALARRIEGSR